MEDLCRICGGASENMLGIFDDQVEEYVDGAKLAEMVKTCADVQLDPDDAMPQKMWISCVHDARTAYGFKRRCEENYKKFYLAILNGQVIKDEPNEEDFLFIENPDKGNLEAKKKLNKEIKKTHQTASRTTKSSITTSRAGRQLRSIKNQTFKCELCIKQFKRQINLLDHMKVHSNSHVCQNCEERFLFKADLDNHRCYRNSNSTVECPVCLKVFSSTQSLDSHKCKDMQERSPFQCPHCQQAFTREQNLKAHLLIHAESKQGNGPHKCSYCQTGFFNKSALKVHIHAHMGERPHACPFCVSNFRSKQALKVHIRIHTGEKPYQCPHCPKTFSDNNNLAKHRRRHSDERPYKCSICLQDFREKHHLKRHFLGKHRDGDQKLKLK